MTEPLIDRVREYWNARPCNVRHSSRPVGTRAYFDEVETRKYFVEPHIPRFAEFSRWRDKTVLEIGCGIGTDTINFARAGAYVFAVDLSDRSLQIAQQRAAVFGLSDRIRFYQRNVEELDGLPVQRFDLIYAFGALHHTPAPDRALEGLRRCCDATTRVKLMVYNRWSTKTAALVLRYGRVAAHSEAQAGCPVTYTFSRRGARWWLERQGFEVTALQVDHIFPYRVRPYVAGGYRRAWRYRALPGFAFRALERSFGWHLLIDAKVQTSEWRR